MKVILMDGTELSPILVTGDIRYTQGTNRDTLSFFFAESESLDTLDSLFTEANCENITIVDSNNVEYIHKEYTIRVELARKPIMVEVGTEDKEAVYENRAVISMAKRTFEESQLAKQASVLNALLTGEE